MNPWEDIVAATLWLLVLGYFCCDTIWGGMADRTYDARMSSWLNRFLMPGPLKSRSFWVRFQKVMAGFGLPFGLFIYLSILARVLHWPVSFLNP